MARIKIVVWMSEKHFQAICIRPTADIATMKMNDGLSAAVMPQQYEREAPWAFAYLNERLLVEMLSKLLYTACTRNIYQRAVRGGVLSHAPLGHG